MLSFRATLACGLVAMAAAAAPLHAQQTGLLPKYGSLPKNEAQRAADDQFFSVIDKQYRGDRARAASDIAALGWQYLKQGNGQDAMRRFNQAWLLDNANASALWGMAAVLASNGKTAESLTLFAEAGRTVGDDIDFSVDYAKALGMAGATAKDDALLTEALSRFERNHERAPQHVMNLQDWAITLFYVGKYADAWEKIRLAEATPGRAELDPRFIAALEAKMPRP